MSCQKRSGRSPHGVTRAAVMPSAGKVLTYIFGLFNLSRRDALHLGLSGGGVRVCIQREGNMKVKARLLLAVSALTIVFAVPAIAQQSMHRYAIYFKYSDAAVKAMTENPQDRGAAAAKLWESFGGKLESIYFFPTGGEFDGFNIVQLPDDVTEEATALLARATGNFPNTKAVPLLTSEEFKAAQEKAKNIKSSYTPPTATKQ